MFAFFSLDPIELVILGAICFGTIGTIGAVIYLATRKANGD